MPMRPISIFFINILLRECYYVLLIEANQDAVLTIG